MKTVTPESMGISSKDIMDYINLLEEYQLATHNVVIARGDSIIYEQYWAPFHQDFLHRQYSVSKSVVSIAVGFAQQDGLLSLDDPISKYFPEETKNSEHTFSQTIRNMLTMENEAVGRGWFHARPNDLVKYYFDNPFYQSRPAGTIFEYDSTGCFILCALVERLTGRKFMDYLREKLFDEIGVSQEAHCLACPGGHSWGDSAILCKPTDMLKIAKFVMNKGKWNGRQILDEDYLTAATACQVQATTGNQYGYSSHGYGYFIWRTWDNSFSFNGMGSQFAICVPDKELILIYNGDNQGNAIANTIIFDGFFRLVARKASPTPLPEDPASVSLLNQPRKLHYAKNDHPSSFQEKVSGAVYALEPNPMGITKLSLDFSHPQCRLNYTNAQGDKTILFGMGENTFDIFPEEGYSDQIGSQRTTGHYYRCAASAAWIEEKKLFIQVQIIDTYFGRLNITLSFQDENTLGIYMNKTAEDFMDTYQGFASGKRVL